VIRTCRRSVPRRRDEFVGDPAGIRIPQGGASSPSPLRTIVARPLGQPASFHISWASPELKPDDDSITSSNFERAERGSKTAQRTRQFTNRETADGGRKPRKQPIPLLGSELPRFIWMPVEAGGCLAADVLEAQRRRPVSCFRERAWLAATRVDETASRLRHDEATIRRAHPPRRPRLDAACSGPTSRVAKFRTARRRLD